MARKDLSGREAGVANVTYLPVIYHGATAGTVRPSSTAFPIILWIGTVQPTNMINGDVFMNVS